MLLEHNIINITLIWHRTSRLFLKLLINNLIKGAARSSCALNVGSSRLLALIGDGVSHIDFSGFDLVYAAAELINNI